MPSFMSNSSSLSAYSSSRPHSDPRQDADADAASAALRPRTSPSISPREFRLIRSPSSSSFHHEDQEHPQLSFSSLSPSHSPTCTSTPSTTTTASSVQQKHRRFTNGGSAAASPISRMFSSLKKRAQALVSTNNNNNNNNSAHSMQVEYHQHRVQHTAPQIPNHIPPSSPPSPSMSLSASISSASAPSSLSSASPSPPRPALDFNLQRGAQAGSMSPTIPSSGLQFHLTVVDVDTIHEQESVKDSPQQPAEQASADPFAKDSVEVVSSIINATSRRGSLFLAQGGASQPIPLVSASPSATSTVTGTTSLPPRSPSPALSLTRVSRRRSVQVPDLIAPPPASPLPSPPSSPLPSPPASPMYSAFATSPPSAFAARSRAAGEGNGIGSKRSSVSSASPLPSPPTSSPSSPMSVTFPASACPYPYYPSGMSGELSASGTRFGFDSKGSLRGGDGAEGEGDEGGNGLKSSSASTTTFVSCDSEVSPPSPSASVVLSSPKRARIRPRSNMPIHTRTFSHGRTRSRSLTHPQPQHYVHASPTTPPRRTHARTPTRIRPRTRTPDGERREMASESETEGRPMHPVPEAVSPAHLRVRGVRVQRSWSGTASASPFSGNAAGRPGSSGGRRPGSGGGGGVRGPKVYTVGGTGGGARRPGSSSGRPGSSGRPSSRGNAYGFGGNGDNSGRPGSRRCSGTGRPGSKAGRPGSGGQGLSRPRPHGHPSRPLASGQVVSKVDGRPRRASTGSFESVSSADTDWTLYLGALGLFAEGNIADPRGSVDLKEEPYEHTYQYEDGQHSTPASPIKVSHRARATADVPHSPSPPQSPFILPPALPRASSPHASARAVKALTISVVGRGNEHVEPPCQEPPSPCPPSSLSASVTAAAARARLAAAVRALDTRFFSSSATSISPSASVSAATSPKVPTAASPNTKLRGGCVLSTPPSASAMCYSPSESSVASLTPSTVYSSSGTLYSPNSVASPTKAKNVLAMPLPISPPRPMRAYSAACLSGDAMYANPYSPVSSVSASPAPQRFGASAASPTLSAAKTLSAYKLAPPPPPGALISPRRPNTPPSPTPAAQPAPSSLPRGRKIRIADVRTTKSMPSSPILAQASAPPLPLSVPRVLPAHRPANGECVGVGFGSLAMGAAGMTNGKGKNEREVAWEARERAKLFSREAQEAPASVLAQLAAGLSSSRSLSQARDAPTVNQKRRSFIDFSAPSSSSGEDGEGDWTLGLGAASERGLGLGMSLGRKRASKVGGNEGGGEHAGTAIAKKASASASVAPSKLPKADKRLSGAAEGLVLGKALASESMAAGSAKVPLRLRAPVLAPLRTRPRSFVLGIASSASSSSAASGATSSSWGASSASSAATTVSNSSSPNQRDQSLPQEDVGSPDLDQGGTPGPSFLDLEWPQPPASPPASLRGATSIRSLHSLHGAGAGTPTTSSVRSLRSVASAVSVSSLRGPQAGSATPTPSAVPMPPQVILSRRTPSPVLTRNRKTSSPMPSPSSSRGSLISIRSFGRRAPLSPVKNRPGTPRRATLPRERPPMPVWAYTDPRAAPIPVSASGTGVVPPMSPPSAPATTAEFCISSASDSRNGSGSQSAPLSGCFLLPSPTALEFTQSEGGKTKASSRLSNASFVSSNTFVSAASTITPSSASFPDDSSTRTKHLSATPSALSIASTFSAKSGASGQSKPMTRSLGRTGARGVARLLKRDEEARGVVASPSARGGIEISGWF